MLKEINMDDKIKNFRDLNIWKKAIELIKKVYEVSHGFPKEELYALSSQMRRSAISIPSNVAEGFRRKHNKEFEQFLYIALGSCAELETQVEIAHELNYVNKAGRNDLLERIDHICRMTSNLIKKLK
jgi:four helix bundle protein